MVADAARTKRAPRDELVTKVLVALRVPGVDVHNVIQAHRRQVIELMQQWTRFKEDETEFDLPFALVVDSELTRLGAVAQWLDMADAHVKRDGQDTRRGSVPETQAKGSGQAMSFLQLHDLSKSYGEGSTLSSRPRRASTCRLTVANSWQ